MKKQSILEQLGINEDNSIEEIIIQLNNNLKGKISDDKLGEIIKQVKDSADKEESKTESFEEYYERESLEKTDTIISDGLEIDQSVQDKNSKSSLSEKTRSKGNSEDDSFDKLKENSDKVAKSIKESSKQVDDFYRSRDKNLFWRKVMLGLSILSAILLLRLNSFQHDIFMVIDYDYPDFNASLAPAITLFISSLSLTILVAIEMKNKPRRRKYASLLTSLAAGLASVLTAVFYIRSIRGLNNLIAQESLLDWSAMELLNNKYVASFSKKIVSYNILSNFSLVFLLISSLLLIYNLMKKIDFTILKRK